MTGEGYGSHHCASDEMKVMAGVSVGALIAEPRVPDGDAAQ